MDECGNSRDGFRKEHPEAHHRWLSQYQCENQPQSVSLPTPEGGQYAGERGVFIQKIFRENYYPNERKIPEKNPQSPQIHGTCIGNQVPQEGRRYPHRAHGSAPKSSSSFSWTFVRQSSRPLRSKATSTRWHFTHSYN